MTRTFWLSFCDDARPEGERFLGVVVVDVDDVRAAAAKILLNLEFPQHRPGAEWIAAAVSRTHWLGVNPGGHVGVMELPPDHPPVPHDRLLSRAELEALGLISPR